MFKNERTNFIPRKRHVLRYYTNFLKDNKMNKKKNEKGTLNSGRVTREVSKIASLCKYIMFMDFPYLWFIYIYRYFYILLLYGSPGRRLVVGVYVWRIDWVAGAGGFRAKESPARRAGYYNVYVRGLSKM